MTPQPVTASETPTAVYRLYNASRVLLYVGITDAPAVRWRDHAKRKPWWTQVASRTLIWHPNRSSAAAEELAAIRTENPLHNKIGKPSECLPHNWNWRSWNVTKNRVIRISEEDWVNFGAICDTEDTDRTADLRTHIQQRIKAYRRKHPGVVLPGDESADA